MDSAFGSTGNTDTCTTTSRGVTCASEDFDLWRLVVVAWKWNRILANLTDNPKPRPSKQLDIRSTPPNRYIIMAWLGLAWPALNYSEATWREGEPCPTTTTPLLPVQKNPAQWWRFAPHESDDLDAIKWRFPSLNAPLAKWLDSLLPIL